MEKLMLVPVPSKTLSPPPLAHNLLSTVFMSALPHALYPGPPRTCLVPLLNDQERGLDHPKPLQCLMSHNPRMVQAGKNLYRSCLFLKYSYAPNSMNQHPR